MARPWREAQDLVVADQRTVLRVVVPDGEQAGSLAAEDDPGGVNPATTTTNTTTTTPADLPTHHMAVCNSKFFGCDLTRNVSARKCRPGKNGMGLGIQTRFRDPPHSCSVVRRKNAKVR